MAALDGRRPDRMPMFNGFWPEFRAAWAREKGVEGHPDLADHYATHNACWAADFGARTC